MAQSQHKESFDEWETVKEAAPTMVAFDTFGDVFIGIKKGKEEITDPNTGNTWNQWQFTGVFPDELAGEHCGINGSYELDRALEGIPDGNEVRLEYVKDVPTHKGNPLKSFDVKQRKPGTRKVTAS